MGAFYLLRINQNANLLTKFLLVKEITIVWFKGILNKDGAKSRKRISWGENQYKNFLQNEN